MSRENIEPIFAAIREALETADIDMLASLFHEECELSLPRNALEGSGYSGPEAARRAFTDAFDSWEAIHLRVDEIRAGADGEYVAIGRTTNVGKEQAPTIEYEAAYVVRLRDGKIGYFRPYLSHREALEAVGLPA